MNANPSLAVMLVLCMFLSGCVQQTPATNDTNVTPTPATNATITISNFAFNPQTLTVKAGTTVTWVNDDPAGHTVTVDGGFSSGTFSKGQSFSHTFNDTGAYDYHCTIHPSMKGKIIVEA